MLDHKTQLDARKVDVIPESIRVKLSDMPNSAALVLPSPAELRQLKKDYAPEISLTDFTASDDPLDLKGMYEEEISRLECKTERFRGSAKFLTHIANLNSLIGKLAEAARYIKSATDARDEPFLVHELGTILIDQSNVDEAWSLFQNCDLKEDVYANLRLAHLSTLRNELSEADRFVQNALAIDSTDYGARMFDGALNLWKNNWEKAIRSFRVAAESSDSSSALFVNLAAAHWGLGQEEKAIRSLRRAIFLDPLNENAVLFLSGVMFMRNTPEDCVAPLLNTLTYEQKNASLWSRIARAYWEMAVEDNNNSQLLRKSLDALKTQASIENKSGVWNNIGVVNIYLDQRAKAHRFFTQSMVRAQDLGEDPALPLSNLLSNLIHGKKFDDAYKISTEFLGSINDEAKQQSSSFSRVLVQRIICLEAIGKRDEASKEAEQLLDDAISDKEVKFELLIHLFFHRTVVNPDLETVIRFLPLAQSILAESDDLKGAARERAVNNTVFAMLSVNDLDGARFYLNELSPLVGVDPFITATYGLFLLKTGRLERAEETYKKAVSLAHDRNTKSRIRQRMLLELGKAYMEIKEPKVSRKFLKNVSKQKGGFQSANVEAAELLLRLLNKQN